MNDLGDMCRVGFRLSAGGGGRKGGKGVTVLLTAMCIAMMSEPGVTVQTCSPSAQEAGGLPGVGGILGTWAVSRVERFGIKLL